MASIWMCCPFNSLQILFLLSFGKYKYSTKFLAFAKYIHFSKINASLVAGKNVRDTISSAQNQIFCPVVVISAGITSANLS